MGTPFIGPSHLISKSQKGNLGEFISYQIARTDYPTPPHRRFAGNGIKPLSKISGSGLDLAYLYFDAVNPKNDLLYIQEVKTTGAKSLGYFDELTSDYKKLFGVDPNLTLQSRIQDIQNFLEYGEDDLQSAERVGALKGNSPIECVKIHLIPTGVSSKEAGDPSTKMMAVRSSICALGWTEDQVKPWSIVMSDLDDRLVRMARGQP